MRYISKYQIVKCKCGNKVAGCGVPVCYTDKKWVKLLRKFVLAGCSVEIIDRSEFDFKKCECKENE